jgi:hypothetical protein
LRHIDLASKLIIIGHGNPWLLEGMTAWQLAHKLRQAGLKQVGLISFKSCNLGVDAFLEDLAVGLSAPCVRFGWLIGYRGPVWMVSGPTRTDGQGIVPHEAVGWEDLALHRFGLKNPDRERIKLVRGNTAVTIPGSRRFGGTSDDVDDSFVLRTITA